MSIIGRKTKTRGTWNIKPIERIKESRKAYNRNKMKKETKERYYEYA